MNAALLGLGEWLPENVRTNDFWPEEVVAKWRERAKESAASADEALASVPEQLGGGVVARYVAGERRDPFLGTQRRHIAGANEKSYETSARAARAALLDGGVEPRDVSVVLSFEAVPDRPAMTGAAKIAELSGATRAHALTVDSGCASPLVQLELAASLIESGRARHVLCTQSFHVTATYPSTHPVSPALGDAATAFLVGPHAERSVLGVQSMSDGRYYDAVCWTRGRDAVTETPWWSPGGPFMYGSRDSARAAEIIQNTAAWGALSLRAAAERAQLDPRSLDLVISVHPRQWVPAGIAEALGVPTERAPHVFAETAHTGGCCLVTNLLEARRRGMLKRGCQVGLYAQGIGFTSSGAILQWAAD
jgi:3-oxoacyl-[acyl-carrier-protein] synthase-3